MRAEFRGSLLTQRKKASLGDPRTHVRKADSAWGWQARESLFFFPFLLTTFFSFFLLLCFLASSSSPLPLFFFFLLLVSASPLSPLSALPISPFSSSWSGAELPGPIPSLSLSYFPLQTPISTTRGAVPHRFIGKTPGYLSIQFGPPRYRLTSHLFISV